MTAPGARPARLKRIRQSPAVLPAHADRDASTNDAAAPAVNAANRSLSKDGGLPRLLREFVVQVGVTRFQVYQLSFDEHVFDFAADVQWIAACDQKVGQLAGLDGAYFAGNAQDFGGP